MTPEDKLSYAEKHKNKGSTLYKVCGTRFESPNITVMFLIKLSVRNYLGS